MYQQTKPTSSLWRKTLLLLGLCAFLPLLAAGVRADSAVSVPYVFQDCAEECPKMALIPPGSYTMGDNSLKDSKSPREVTLDYSYALSVTEITFDQWQFCVDDGACEGGQSDHGWGRGTRPLINLTYVQAEAYTDWLSQKTGIPYRLPSEAEWEWAARGGTESAYWWGDDVGEGKVNCRHCGTKWSGIGSAPVASFGVNPFGLYDTSGNVWEWTADCWSKTLANHPTDGQPLVEETCRSRAIRGGAWYYIPVLAKSAARARNHAGVWSYTVGLRVLREVSDAYPLPQQDQTKPSSAQ